jgi:hypothetical protein
MSELKAALDKFVAEADRLQELRVLADTICDRLQKVATPAAESKRGKAFRELAIDKIWDAGRELGLLNDTVGRSLEFVELFWGVATKADAAEQTGGDAKTEFDEKLWHLSEQINSGLKRLEEQQTTAA